MINVAKRIKIHIHGNICNLIITLITRILNSFMLRLYIMVKDKKTEVFDIYHNK